MGLAATKVKKWKIEIDAFKLLIITLSPKKIKKNGLGTTFTFDIILAFRRHIYRQINSTCKPMDMG